MNLKSIVFGLVFVAIASFASASCWDIQSMPNGQWTYSAWICNSSQVVGMYYHSPTEWGPFSMMLHGQIETTNPQNSSSAWRVYLLGFQYANPYPATLKCYKRMGVSGNYWWMYTGYQITLVDGNYTQGGTQWVTYGCPPIINAAHQQIGDTQQVQIGVDWGGYGTMASKSRSQATSAIKARRR
ncbi:Uncharacterised protein [Candidatus Norongarragalina meridionalis]|nr:Uncharacterised protein [Candidatus Norongarragalina meridionalis]